jgi:hypothetical protein
VPKLFEELRKTYGFDHHLLHDGHHRYTPQEAANLGKMLEPFQLFWLEDCTPAENQEAFKLVRQHTTTPLAVGEIFNTIWDAKDLIQNQLIDYIRATVVGAGGLTHLRRIADLASLYQVRTGCHGATDLSPVTMGCALHFDTWVPNFGIQEYMRHTPETDAVFPHDYWFEKGELFVGETPAMAWTSTKTSPPSIPTSRPTCPSPAWKTARCGTGEHGRAGRANRLPGRRHAGIDRGGRQFRLGHGGDTLNTAIHLARAGHDVAFFSALGTDPFSARLRAAWVNEGVDDRLILTHPTRGAGSMPSPPTRRASAASPIGATPAPRAPVRPARNGAGRGRGRPGPAALFLADLAGDPARGGARSGAGPRRASARPWWRRGV